MVQGGLMEQVIEVITAYLPSIAAISGILVAVISTIGKVSNAIDSLKHTSTEQETRLKEEIAANNQEIERLTVLLMKQQNQINELLTEMTKVEH